MRGQKGFSLLELLLYVTTAAILVGAISSLVLVLFQGRTKAKTISEVEEQGNQAMHLILQTIRNSESINTPTAGSSGASLSLQQTVVANNPTVFDLSSGALRITEGASAAVTITSSRVTASSLTFRNLTRSGTPGVVQVQFTLTYVNNSNRNEYSYAKTFISSASLRQ